MFAVLCFLACWLVSLRGIAWVVRRKLITASNQSQTQRAGTAPSRTVAVTRCSRLRCYSLRSTLHASVVSKQGEEAGPDSGTP